MKKEKNTHSSVTCTSANKPVIRPRKDTSQFPSHVNRNHHICIVIVIFEKSQCCLMRIECSFESFYGIIQGADRFGANLIGVIERIQAAACHRRPVWRWSCLKNGRRLKGSCPGEQRHTEKWGGGGGKSCWQEQEEERMATLRRRTDCRGGTADGKWLQCRSLPATLLVWCVWDYCLLHTKFIKNHSIIYRVLHFIIHRYWIPKNIVLSTE